MSLFDNIDTDSDEGGDDGGDMLFGGVDMSGAVSDEEAEEPEAGALAVGGYGEENSVGLGGVGMSLAFAKMFRGPAKPSAPMRDARDLEAAQRECDRLVQWVLDSGGAVHRSLELRRASDEGDSGIGAYCTANVGVGEVLLRVPSACLLFCDEEGLRGLDVDPPPHVTLFDLKQIGLAVLLWTEMSLGADSFFAPYLDTLPQQFSSFPINWTPDELRLLSVSRNLSTLLRAQAGALHREYMHFHARALAMSGTPPRCTFAEYCNAKLVVSSRCFGVGRDIAMIPLIDMLNHHHFPHVKVGIVWGGGGEGETGGVRVACSFRPF